MVFAACKMCFRGAGRLVAVAVIRMEGAHRVLNRYGIAKYVKYCNLLYLENLFSKFPIIFNELVHVF